MSAILWFGAMLEVSTFGVVERSGQVEQLQVLNRGAGALRGSQNP